MLNITIKKETSKVLFSKNQEMIMKIQRASS
jgi:hypothetical protein